MRSRSLLAGFPGRALRVPLVLMVLLLLFGAAAPLRPAAAWQATPAPGALSLPLAPDPALCQIPPRPVADLKAIIGATLPPTPTVFHEPAGTPADKAVIDAVTRTVVEDIACQNAGDYGRVAALYTAAGLAEDYIWFTEDDLEWFTAPPEPRDEADRNIVASVSQVEMLPDGRVGARVAFGDQGKYGSDYLIFAEQDGRYLIDHWVDELLVTAAGDPDGMRLISIGDRSLAMLC